MPKISWLALSYNLPKDPSKARVYTWRKLKEYGAEYLRQGIAVLPNTAISFQQFTALAQKIRQMGGEATLVEMRFLTIQDEQEMAARFKKQLEDEYKELLEDCANALRQIRIPGQTVTHQESEKIRRMVKRYQRARERDYFKSCPSSEIEAGLNELIDSVRLVAADFGRQLRSLLDSN